MIDLEAIVTALSPLVRLQQADNPDAPVLGAAITEPLTARLCYHPLLKAENLDAISPNFDTMNWPAWVDGAFVAGKTVTHLGSYWTASVAIVAGEVPGTSAKWLERGKLTDYLLRRREEAVRTAIVGAMNCKKADDILRETLNDTMLYEGAGTMNDLIVKKGRLVGFEIEVLNNNGLQALLKQISFQLSTAGTFNVYLWHASQTDPIATFEVTQTKQYSVEWHNLPADDFLLKFRDADYDSGLFYLGYYEDDLPGQAVNKRSTFGRTPCATCNGYNRKAYIKYSQYVRINTFQVGAPPASQKLWDIRKTNYAYDTNWGMNLRLDALCDITDYIINKGEVFADFIMEQLKYDLILEMANTTRSNVLSEPVVNMARAAIQDKHLGGEGLQKQLEKSREAAWLELSDIERNVCAPQQKPKGVRSSNIRIENRPGRSRL